MFGVKNELDMLKRAECPDGRLRSHYDSASWIMAQSHPEPMRCCLGVSNMQDDRLGDRLTTGSLGCRSLPLINVVTDRY